VPSSSKKQHNFMAAVAHSPSFAKKVGVPQSVGKDFNEADKGRKFKKGGDTMATKSMKAIFAGKETKAEEKAERKATGGSKTAYKRAEKMYEGETMKKGGAVSRSSASKRADGIAQRGKTRGILLNKGGMARGCK
jgi:hypothetical protein